MNIYILVALILFSVMAVFLRDLLKSAICLAVASIFLAVMFFRMGATYAGVFEVSVVAGLITVLFITVIALTNDDAKVPENKWPIIIFPVALAIFIIFDIWFMNKFIILPSKALPLLAQGEKFGDVLWGQRTFDLLGQIGVIFAGVFGVFAFFRRKTDE
ncbi:MAG: hypothetical protein A2252_11230 [Elusimicrobia bacterium RIFOXYA2_FULL_39_19]|nr:MAG: hypothetical protein A2252_11230 [Elusimicrobia bacterium RIFOXYA2_FULL_39_19]